MTDEKKILKGKNITRLWTIGSWNASGKIIVFYNERVKTASGWQTVNHETRIHVDTLLAILQKYDFEMLPTRTYDILENPKKHREKKK